tara:strand:+ start:184 stop:636 length:453 start_codon:yes stop_codon:yes gene_type:complete
MNRFIYLLILLFILISLFLDKKHENFKNDLDNIDGMDLKMKEMSDLEEETRMFCKILRHDQGKNQLDNLLNSRNRVFQENWKKQNKTINDIKKKFIKLRLEKDGRNLIDYNNNRNQKKDEFSKRKKILKKAKQIADLPYNLKVNVNNNSN